MQNASTPAFFIYTADTVWMSTQQEPCLSTCSREAVCGCAGLALHSHSSLDDGRVYVCAALPSPPPGVVSAVPNSRLLSWFAANQKLGPAHRLRPVDKADAQMEKHQSVLRKRNTAVP